MRFHRRSHAPDERLDHAVLPCDDLRMVNRDVLCRHAVIRAMQRCLILLGAVQKALGRDAAFVQAGAAQRALFNQRRSQSGFSRAFRAKISARPPITIRSYSCITNSSCFVFSQCSIPGSEFVMLILDVRIPIVLFYVVFRFLCSTPSVLRSCVI